MVFHSQTKPVKCSLLPVGTIYSTYSMWHFKKSINFSFEPQNTEEEKKMGKCKTVWKHNGTNKEIDEAIFQTDKQKQTTNIKKKISLPLLFQQPQMSIFKQSFLSLGCSAQL